MKNFCRTCLCGDKVTADQAVVAGGAIRNQCYAAGGRHANTMKTSSGREYCLIVEGAYLTESEAEHALRDPFIEDWVEQTGHFRVHNMAHIEITPGVALGMLGVVMLDERIFEIASVDADHPLNEGRAKGIAEALRRQDMFDEIKVVPRGEWIVDTESSSEGDEQDRGEIYL